MSDLIRTVLIMSISGSIIALLLFALKPLTRNRLPKAAQYYLWLVVIAALLVPVSKMFVIGNNAMPIPVAPIQSALKQVPITSGDEIAIWQNDPNRPQTQEEVQRFKASQNSWLLLPYLYPFIAVAVLLYFIISYAIFTRRLKRRNKPADIPCDIPVFRNPLASTPMLIGLFCPAIILPDCEYSEAQLQVVLQHELTHLRRKDVIVKWVALLASAVHWFNPVVWFVRREIDRACELACDEAIIKRLDTSGKQEYGDTLIAVAAGSVTLHPMSPVGGTMAICEDKKTLKERLGAIMKSKKHTRSAIVASGVLVLVSILTACVLGAGSSGTPIFTAKETTDRYGYKMGENRIDEVLLPDEYEFTGRFTIDGDDLTSRLVSKVLFAYKGKEYYFYYNLMGLEYNNTTYPDIYNVQTDEKAAALWEKPQGMFQLDNYLYYAYGSERRVREYDLHNFRDYYMWYKDFHYARLNLDTMENEEIPRAQYEETWDYQEFRQWRSNVSAPVTKLDVFVWRENDATLFNLKDGDNPKYKRDWYEHGIYRPKDAPTFSVYNAPNLITNNIDEFNKMIRKFPDAETITVYQMHDTDFTEQEMAEIIGSIAAPNEWCVKMLMLWSDVLDADAP